MGKKAIGVMLVVMLAVAVLGGMAWAGQNGQIDLIGIESALISYGMTSFSADGRTLMISGSTNTDYVVEYVGVKLHIQRLENGVWKDYYTWTTAEAFNKDTVSDIKTLTVPGGYWYRGKSRHVATDGSISDSSYSYTPEKFVQ